MLRLPLEVILLMCGLISAFAPSAGAHYRPDVGRWLERDPYSIDGLNLYGYARSCPSKGGDPTGLTMSWEECNNQIEPCKKNPLYAMVMQAIRAKKCSVPKIRCDKDQSGTGSYCPKKDEDGKAGYMCCHSKEIIICPGAKWFLPETVCETIIHELWHYENWCNDPSKCSKTTDCGGVDLTCKEIACDEIRSASLSGECCKNFTGRECVKEGAKKSTRGRKAKDGTLCADKDVDDAWEECYNDDARIKACEKLNPPPKKKVMCSPAP